MNATQNTSTGTVPLANQISELLIREIHAGILPDGERLPPERQMATRLGVIEHISRDHHGLPAEYPKTWFDPEHVRFVAR